MYNRRTIGSEQESRAKEYLIQQGYEIIEQNFFTRTGEIDIIAKDGLYLVFIEVKYRKKTTYGFPEESISKQKMRTIVRTARYYLYRNGYPVTTPCRFDVIVFLDQQIHLIKNAFEAI